jgi:hypothetical protein
LRDGLAYKLMPTRMEVAIDEGNERRGSPALVRTI